MRSRLNALRLLVALTVVAVLGGAVGLSRASAPSQKSLVGAATAASLRLGHDISWPQCGTGRNAGIATRLPAGRAPFVIVGLTNGRALHDNPCLTGQLRYGNSRTDHVSAYLMANRPTAGELAAASTVACGTDRLCNLRQVGVNEATSALATLARHGYSAGLVWIDVETRRAQPWSRSDLAGNDAVLRGIAAGLTAAGVTPGYYSTRTLWHVVAGSLRVPGAAEWYAIGHSSRAGLLKACSLSFGGGTTVVTQAVIGGFDADQLCRTGRAGSVLAAMTLHRLPVPVAVPTATAPPAVPPATGSPVATAAPAATPTAGPSAAPTASPSASPSLLGIPLR